MGGDGEVGRARGFRCCPGVVGGEPLVCGALLVQLWRGGWALLAMCPHVLSTHRLSLARAVPAGAPATAGAGGPSQPRPCEQHALHLGAHPRAPCTVEVSGCAQADLEMIIVLSWRGTHTNTHR